MASIGIDLGTTNSCVAVVQDGNVKIITNKQGNRTTPSYVAFTKTEYMAGDPAKNQAATNPSNTIFDAKRLIGRRYDDEVVKEDIARWPFKVVNKNNKPYIEVQTKKGKKQLRAVEVSAMILKEMKEIAVDFLGKEVRKAVITVPAYFNDAQRQSTKVAGQIAGLDVMKIINEPTAAALAYKFGKKNDIKSDVEKRVLMYDLGGGTFDVSILLVEDGVLEVKSTSGDTHLGGEDFTTRLVEHFAEEIKTRFGYEIEGNRKALGRLRRECETVKKSLSTLNEEKISIASLINNKDFTTNISRSKFEALNEDLFHKTLEILSKALDDAKLKPADIDEIVLVGGSTRIPKVKQLVKEYFGGRQLRQDINPDEAVAEGAAIQAAILMEETTMNQDLKDTVLIDVTPLSLGIKTSGGIMNVIIPRNSSIPRQETKRFKTKCDNQTAVDIIVYEGEKPLTKDNNKLGYFEISGIEPRQRGKTSILVTFAIDSDGILKVTAVERSGNVEKNMEIRIEKGRLTEEEIEKMIAEAEKFNEENKNEKARNASKLQIENICLTLKSDLKFGNLRNSKSEKFKEQLNTMCEEALNWLSKNQDSSEEVLKEKIGEIQEQSKKCGYIFA